MACNQASLITLVLRGLLRAKTPLNNPDFKYNLYEEVHEKKSKQDDRVYGNNSRYFSACR